MGMLENIQTGRENKPPRIMVYGQEGVGKSTFGASAPDPVFIQTEDGLGEIDTCKFPLAQSVGGAQLPHCRHRLPRLAGTPDLRRGVQGIRRPQH